MADGGVLTHARGRQRRGPRLLAVAVLVVALIAPLAPTGLEAADGLFTKTIGFATKTGFRGVFAWEATAPVLGTVHYGTSPDAMTSTVSPFPGTPDTAQMAIADLTEGETYYWQVEDGLTGERSPVSSFETLNATTDWDGSIYTLDLLIQLDTESLPPEIPHDLALENIAAGVNIFAERLYDALDGYARLGNVLITDTNLDYGVNIPFQPPGCVPGVTNAADVLIETSVPMDSHTFRGAIEDPCIGFYVGRLGQLGAPWGILTDEDLHFGYVATHEMLHYAFYAPDLYSLAPNGGAGDCRNLDWDGSLMHNTGGWEGKWVLTELDRNETLTPCTHGTNVWSWDALRGDTDRNDAPDDPSKPRYINVPRNPNGPIDHMFDTKARGNEDGGALDIHILDRQQLTLSSTLTSFEPHDGVVECGPLSPVLVDPQGDASMLGVETGLLPSPPSLDITSGSLSWDSGADVVSFGIGVDDLTADPPLPGLGKYFRYWFSYAGQRFEIRAASDDITSTTSFALNYFTGDATDVTTQHLADLSGSFDVDADEVVIDLPVDLFNSRVAEVFAAEDPPREVPPVLGEGSLLEAFQAHAQRWVGGETAGATLSADTATGNCPYVIGQEVPNAAPTAAADSARTKPRRAVTIDVLDNDADPDGDDLQVAAPGTSNKGGRLTVNEDGSISYKPRRRFVGRDRFTYTVTDGRGGVDSALVTLRVR